jgi:hypothetical protein
MSTRVGDRSNLRIADLKGRKPRATRQVNWKLPIHLIEAVNRMAEEMGTTKTQIIIALLNAGLEQGGKIKKK